MKSVKEMSLNELEHEKSLLQKKDSLFGKEKMRLKKISNEILKRKNKIDTTGTFSNDDMQKDLKLQYVDIDKIVMPEYNDRTGIDNKKIKELAESIKEDGLIQNPILEQIDGDKFLKIVGRRRILASKLNGEKKILSKVLTKKISEFEKDLIIWNENNQREDLNLYDKVRFHLKFVKNEFNLENEDDAKKLIENCNYLKKRKKENTEEENAKVLKLEQLLKRLKGYKTITALSNNLPVLKFDEIILNNLIENRITYKLAKLLEKNKEQIIEKYSNDKFIDILNIIIKEEYSVNEASNYITQLLKEDLSKSKEQIKFEKSYKEFKKIVDTIEEDKYVQLTEILEEAIKKLK